MISFNREVFQAFRKHAVTNPADIKVGNTYYFNFGDPNKAKVVAKIETDLEHYLRKDLVRSEHDMKKDNTQPRWVIFEDGSEDSLHDNNVGASYNPWLMFESKELAVACKQVLEVTYCNDNDYFYSYFFDSDYFD